MIDDTLAKIETRLAESGTLTEEQRRELRELLATLRTEITRLSKTDAEQAQSIAGFTEVSTHEATRESQNPRLLRLSLEGLTSSVERLEQSHPKLIQVVNAVSKALSDLGI